MYRGYAGKGDMQGSKDYLLAVRLPWRDVRDPAEQVHPEISD